MPTAGNLRVRRACREDAPRIAEIHVRSWQAAYRGILPDALLDGLSVSEREQSWDALLHNGDSYWLTLVAEGPGGALTGFCSVATPSRDEGAGAKTAEIGALYVDPGHWHEGAGSGMLSAALAELAGRGWRDVVLWVLPENRPALAFYNRFGFAVEEGAEKLEERSGRPVIRLRTELDQPIRLVPYDPSWPDQFAEEQVALDAAIGSWATGGIHHIGSTAVPGLDAKPIIDILVGVDSLEASRACFDPLANLAYLHAPYLADEMHWFCKPHPARRTHHLHLVPTDSRRFRDELVFCKRLRESPQAAEEYAALKHDLADRFADDREAYTDAKAAFIRRLL
ncbi:MAG: bifunctional GNAT family N-acetyltransferase/GrpB family protein [Solirubrobacterales bacterium]